MGRPGGDVTGVLRAAVTGVLRAAQEGNRGVAVRKPAQARLGLSHSLWAAGRREEAVRHLQDMLRLNPDENQGVRYTLAGFPSGKKAAMELAGTQSAIPVFQTRSSGRSTPDSASAWQARSGASAPTCLRAWARRRAGHHNRDS
jgi:hypothetical protein